MFAADGMCHYGHLLKLILVQCSLGGQFQQCPTNMLSNTARQIQHLGQWP